MFTLHNGDCLAVLPSIPSGSIDAIITDIPYGTTSIKWDSIIPFVPMWEQVQRVLKSSGVFITTSSQPFTSALIMSNPKYFKYEWIWEKTIPTGVAQSSYMPMKYHENILIFGNSKPTFNKIMAVRSASGKARAKTPINGSSTKGSHFHLGKQVKRQYDPNFVNPKSVLKFGSVANSKGKIHPTQKPVALYEYLIRTYTNEGETVLDIAMGSGTTIEAAERTGRNSIGIEKDEGIFQSAVLRLKSLTPSNNRLQPTAFGVGTQAQFPLLGGTQAEESSATHGGG